MHPHSCVLASASPTLRKQFWSERPPYRVHVDGISGAVWQVVLHFVYVGELWTLDAREAVEVAAAGRRLGMEALAKKASMYAYTDGNEKGVKAEERLWSKADAPVESFNNSASTGNGRLCQMSSPPSPTSSSFSFSNGGSNGVSFPHDGHPPTGCYDNGYLSDVTSSAEESSEIEQLVRRKTATQASKLNNTDPSRLKCPAPIRPEVASTKKQCCPTDQNTPVDRSKLRTRKRINSVYPLLPWRKEKLWRKLFRWMLSTKGAAAGFRSVSSTHSGSQTGSKSKFGHLGLQTSASQKRRRKSYMERPDRSTPTEWWGETIATAVHPKKNTPTNACNHNHSSANTCNHSSAGRKRPAQKFTARKKKTPSKIASFQYKPERWCFKTPAPKRAKVGTTYKTGGYCSHGPWNQHCRHYGQHVCGPTVNNKCSRSNTPCGRQLAQAPRRWLAPTGSEGRRVKCSHHNQGRYRVNWNSSCSLAVKYQHPYNATPAKKNNWLRHGVNHTGYWNYCSSNKKRKSSKTYLRYRKTSYTQGEWDPGEGAASTTDINTSASPGEHTTSASDVSNADRTLALPTDMPCSHCGMPVSTPSQIASGRLQSRSQVRVLFVPERADSSSTPPTPPPEVREQQIAPSDGSSSVPASGQDTNDSSVSVGLGMSAVMVMNSESSPQSSPRSSFVQLESGLNRSVGVDARPQVTDVQVGPPSSAPTTDCESSSVPQNTSGDEDTTEDDRSVSDYDIASANVKSALLARKRATTVIKQPVSGHSNWINRLGSTRSELSTLPIPERITRIHQPEPDVGSRQTIANRASMQTLQNAMSRQTIQDVASRQSILNVPSKQKIKNLPLRQTIQNAQSRHTTYNIKSRHAIIPITRFQSESGQSVDRFKELGRSSVIKTKDSGARQSTSQIKLLSSSAADSDPRVGAPRSLSSTEPSEPRIAVQLTRKPSLWQPIIQDIRRRIQVRWLAGERDSSRQTHHKFKSTETMWNEVIDSVIPKEKVAYICPKCGQGLESRRLYYKHMLEAHLNN